MNTKIFINLIASISYAFVQWFILTYISREISSQAAGEYALYLAVFSPVAILCSFGLRNQIATDAENNFRRDSYQAVLFLGNVVFLFSSFIIAVYYQFDIFFSVVFLIKLVELNSEKIYGEWIKIGKTKLYSFSRIYKSLLTLSLIVTIGFINKNSEKIILAYPAAFLSVFLFFDLVKRKKSNDNYITLNFTENTRKLLIFSLPVILSAFVVSLRVSVPRIILSKFESIEFVATFTMLVYFGSVAIIPLMSAFPVYMAEFSKNKNLVRIKKATILILLYILLFIICMFAFSNIIMQKVYMVSNYRFIDIIFATGIGATQIFLVWLSFLLTTMRDFKYLFFSNFLNLLLVSVVSIILGKSLLMTGVLLSVIVANIIQIIMNLININNNLKKCRDI